jgi:CheY-like chemotaxis protein
VRLPRRFSESAMRAATVGPEASASPSSSGRRVPRVLVIDDEEPARYVVKKLLMSLPAEVEEARGGTEGIQYARERDIDLIVLDLVMDDATGFNVIAALKEEPLTRDIPVVVHTSMTLGQAERDALSHARAIVSKSRTEPDLRDVVKSLVAAVG